MKVIFILSLLLMVMSNSAYAHPGHNLDSIYAGFLHPLTGWDHLLVMLAVGIWATRFDKATYWQMPLTFLVFMLTGMALSAIGVHFQFLELAISSSVVVMGLLLAMTIQLPKRLGMLILMIFASFHGMAHGAELSNQQLWLAMLGMLIATGCLHLVGLGLGIQQKPIMKILNIGLAWFMLVIGAYWTLA